MNLSIQRMFGVRQYIRKSPDTLENGRIPGEIWAYNVKAYGHNKRFSSTYAQRIRYVRISYQSFLTRWAYVVYVIYSQEFAEMRYG